MILLAVAVAGLEINPDCRVMLCRRKKKKGHDAAVIS